MPHHTLQITQPGDRELLITRAFDAPRHLVFDALIRPDQLKRWLTGPDGWVLVVCEIDLRAGGNYRCVWRDAEGVEMGMGGTYREIVRPERLVRTERFDQDWTGGETLCTAVLTECDSVTTLDTTVRYGTAQARDGALASGMERGIAQRYDRMEALLQEPAA
ncbi:SRPBCC family protein [Ralstonia solanacearum]|uniref:SRPBCC family protein n=1 Tax=Ralstonia solanacearum TaxID=305 RepID=UPI0006DC1BCE|nr:SRPBCC family protein [Ralstonia solanacearum]